MGSKHIEVCSLANEEGLEEWTLFTDGASNLKGAGVGLVLIDLAGTEYTYAIRLNFSSTNNETKYEALLARLLIAEKMKVGALNVKVDSMLVACQLNGEFVASNEGMAKYLAKELSVLFRKFSIENVPRNQNQMAGVLSKLASVAFKHLTKEVLVEVLNAKVSVQKVIHVSNAKMHRSAPGKLHNKGNTRRSMQDVCQSTISNGENHAAGPFYQWGLDILGPLSEGPGKLMFIIVAIDYFNKWMEAKPLDKITGKEVKKFDWENIVCRFGLPRVIMTDNETRLVNDPFKSWCKKWKIKQVNTAVAYPQANRLVERANKSLMHGFKARLGRERVGWVDKLPNILWAHRTMLKTNNGKTPFSLTYGSEAVISTRRGMLTYRVIQYSRAQNKEEMRLNLDIRETIAI
uniref:Protein NYNRIN-like n=1 Tax=Tanacetum cinerariifolium TaxID=118510 RepID=A0A6L2MKQ4_TANCI|nr:protein NYNRIN-like [Tanacetum cinerariifolium]